jgi:uncharacterized membrane protein
MPSAEAFSTAHGEELAEKDTDRLEAFSDGVFAVALTLLVVSLAVPEIGAGRAVSARALFQALAGQWPQFVAFAASFFSVLLLWISHHQTFAMIRRTSRHLMLANGLLLFLVTLIPFPTAVLARYIQTPGGSVVAALYAGVFLLITASFILLWHVVLSRPGMLREDMTDVQKRTLQRRNSLGLVPYVLAVGAAFWQPYLTVLICISLSVYWVVSGGDS